MIHSKAHTSLLALAAGLALTAFASLASAQAVSGPPLDNPLPAAQVGAQATLNPQLFSLKSAPSLVNVFDIRAHAGGGVRTPFCRTADGWLGGLYVYRPGSAPARTLCVANNGTGDRSVSPPAGTWAPGSASFSWKGWTANQLEPRGGAILFSQTNGRAMRPCASNENEGTPNATTVLGYVGDDGRCYGASVAGFSQTNAQTSYLGQATGFSRFALLMGATNEASLLPTEGWVSVRDARLPRGMFEAYGGNVACRGVQGSDRWAGYVNQTTKQCDLFTQYGQTRRASVRDYEVYRVIRCTTQQEKAIGTLGTADKLCTYPLGGQTRTTDAYSAEVTLPGARTAYARVANEDYWLCYGQTITNLATGAKRSFFGFTNNRGGCTDGTQNVVVPLRGKNEFNVRVTVYDAPADGRG